jgi:hypothetical protein
MQFLKTTATEQVSSLSTLICICTRETESFEFQVRNCWQPKRFISTSEAKANNFAPRRIQHTCIGA